MWLLSERAMQLCPTQEEIRERAYYLWEQRGRPIGSPATDWERAEQELRCEQAAAQMAGWARRVPVARARRPRTRRLDPT